MQSGKHGAVVAGLDMDPARLHHRKDILLETGQATFVMSQRV